MKSIFLFLISLILLINICSALEIGLNPAKMNFTGFVNEDVCNYLKIRSDYNGELNGDMRFTYGGKSFEDFKISPNELGIKAIYPREIAIDRYEEVRVCLKSDREIESKGILLYYTKNGYAGVGSLVFLKISRNQIKSKMIIGLVLMQSFLVFELFILLYFNKKIRKTS